MPVRLGSCFFSALDTLHGHVQYNNVNSGTAADLLAL